MRYDLIILGGGPAGYLAAERAGGSGLKVLVVEKENVGGVCLNEGCIPTKTLLYSAKIYDNAVNGKKYGVTAENLAFDHKAVMARKKKVIKLLVGGVKNVLKENGAELVQGAGTITGKTSDGNAYVVAANGESYEGVNLLIATGSRPFMPGIPGLNEAYQTGFVLTNREVLELEAPPAALVVIGGGVIGLEMASYFNSTGTKVTVIEMLDHIAGENDGEISAILQKNYERRGIEFKLACKVTAVNEGSVEYETADGEKIKVECDKVLASIGRRPNVEGIGLETIAVATERGAIVCDDHMRTNVPNVYAAGDVNGRSMLAHTAYRESEVAINNILGQEDTMRYNAIPAVIYTNPELGAVGETEDTARAKGFDVSVVKLPMRFSGRYLAENEGGDGIFKLVVDAQTKRIIGAHALCNYASEFIVSAGIMIETGMTVEQAKKLVFPHPTVGEIIREAIFQCN